MERTTQGPLSGNDAPPGMWTAAERSAASAREPVVIVESLRDGSGSTSHLVYDEVTRIGVIIDPTDGPRGTRTRLERLVEDLGIDLQLVLDTGRTTGTEAVTHFVQRHGARAAIGSGSAATLTDHPTSDPRGCPFDVLVQPGDELRAGPLRIEAVSRAGHVPAAVGFRVGDLLFGATRERTSSNPPWTAAGESGRTRARRGRAFTGLEDAA